MSLYLVPLALVAVQAGLALWLLALCMRVRRRVYVRPEDWQRYQHLAQVLDWDGSTSVHQKVVAVHEERDQLRADLAVERHALDHLASQLGAARQEADHLRREQDSAHYWQTRALDAERARRDPRHLSHMTTWTAQDGGPITVTNTSTP